MERPTTLGFQKPIDSGQRHEVGLAVITYERDETSGAVAAGCSCGWVCWHKREKVVEDKIDSHLSRRHQGRGIRL